MAARQVTEMTTMNKFKLVNRILAPSALCFALIVAGGCAMAGRWDLVIINVVLAALNIPPTILAWTDRQ